MSIDGRLDIFKHAYETHINVLIHFAYRYVPLDIAENIVHDVFTDIWKRRLQEEISISYLLGAVRNRCVNYLQREDMHRIYKEKTITEAELNQSYQKESIEETIIENEKLQWVYDCIDQLPEQRRKIFKQAYLYGDDNSKIAASFNLSINTVKNHLCLALKQLRKQLANT